MWNVTNKFNAAHEHTNIEIYFILAYERKKKVKCNQMIRYFTVLSYVLIYYLYFNWIIN